MNKRIKKIMNEYVKTTPLNQWRDLKYVSYNKKDNSQDIVNDVKIIRRKHMKGSAVIAILAVCLVIAAIIVPVSILTSKNSISEDNSGTKLDPTDQTIDVGNSTYAFNGITYELFEDKTAAVVSSSALLINATIVDTITYKDITYNVNEIADQAFKTSLIKTVLIPNSIIRIGEYAFSGCKYLTNVVIPNSVTSIGKGCFNNCTGLKNITLSNEITVISESLFNNCTALEKVILPNKVVSISKNAFNSCSSLVTISIPNGVQEIKTNAFKNCFALIEIVNDSDLNIVCGDVGYGYIGYYAINVRTEEDNSKIREENDFYLFEDSSDIYLVKYVGTKQSINIPNVVTVIYNYAFANMLFIKNVNIPESVKAIGESAFSYTCIESITIPSSVQSIGQSCFESCSLLKNVILGEGVSSIPYSCFCGCEDLKNVQIEGIVVEIGEDAFSSDNNLEIINIKEGLLSIGKNAFNECYQLKEVYIPSSIQTIGEDAFKNCYHLREIYNLSELNIEKGTTTYGEIALNALYVYNSTNVESKISILEDGLQVVVDDDTEFYAVIGYYGDKTVPMLPNNIMGHNYILYDYAFYTIPYFNSYEFYEYQALNGFITDLDYKVTSEFVIPTGCIGINKYACNSYYSNIKICSGVNYIQGLAFYDSQLDSIVFEESQDWYIIGGVSEVYFNNRIFNINDINYLEYDEYPIDVVSDAFVELLTKKAIIGVWHQGRMVSIGDREETVFIKK